MKPIKSNNVKAVGYDENVLYVQFYYEEHTTCYNYGCLGTYNEEIDEYEYDCDNCEYRVVVPAHDQVFSYTMDNAKEEYEKMIGGVKHDN